MSALGSFTLKMSKLKVFTLISKLKISKVSKLKTFNWKISKLKALNMSRLAIFSLKMYKLKTFQCVKSVRIRSYSGPHFPRIFPHSDWIRRDSISPYSVRMRENAGKMGTRITPNTYTFYAVFTLKISNWKTLL